MANLRRSLAINFIASTGGALMTFVLSVLLARLLSPSELGVYSMAVVFVNIAHIFRDFGVGSYLQREPDLTSQKIRSAIGVLFTSSWLIALALFMVASWMAEWLKEPQVEPLMRVLAVGFLFIPFGAITNALLARELAADKQAVIATVGVIAYCVSCLGFAVLGLGTMSMAWANLVNTIVTALACILTAPKGVPWLPSFRQWRGVMNYGMGALASNFVTTVNHAVPDLLLGKIGSARLVGLLSRANSTVSLFSYIVGSTVTYGALSYLSQAYHRGESLAPILGRATTLLTGIGWPALALTAVLGHDVVLSLYGDQWLSCVAAIFPITLAAAVGMVYHYLPTALMAIGRPYLGAMPVVVTLLTRVVLGILLFDGTLVSFAWAVCLATLAALPVMTWLQYRHLGISLGATLASLLSSAQVTLACLGTAVVLRMLLPATINGIAALCLLLPALAAVWYLALRLVRHALVGEVHRLANTAWTRLGQLRPVSSN